MEVGASGEKAVTSCEMRVDREEAVPSHDVGADRECHADWVQTLAVVVCSFPSTQFDACLQELLLDMVRNVMINFR